MNFHPLRLALTARSMSSTVVRSFHPPASFRAEILHTPAVPATTLHDSNGMCIVYFHTRETYKTSVEVMRLGTAIIMFLYR